MLLRSREVEASLWRRFRFDKQEDCRSLLFKRYAIFARTISRKEYKRRPLHGLEREDYEHLAFGGLLEAIDRFDPMKGVPFEAFLLGRIRGAISDGAARSSEGAARYSARRQTQSERLSSFREDAISADPVGALTDLAVALAVGLIADNAGRRLTEPEELADELEGGASALSPYEGVAWRDLEMRVVSEIRRLKEPDKTVIEQHYLSGVSFSQIAALLQVSKSRVSQIHRGALRMVRDRLRPEE